MHPELAARVLEGSLIETLDILLSTLAMLQGFDHAELTAAPAPLRRTPLHNQKAVERFAGPRLLFVCGTATNKQCAEKTALLLSNTIKVSQIKAKTMNYLTSSAIYK